ncbi:MAG: LCP family protein [Symbiobacterium sp.]|uniref:LCP family protein n=1 Tax=Symbiobacterium sp. TaxID=1971213 RepID=UPI003464A9C1
MRRFLAGAALGFVLSLSLAGLAWRLLNPPPAAPAPPADTGLVRLDVGAEPPEPAQAAAEPVYVLVMGVDERPGDRGRSDTMLLVRAGAGPLRVLSLPRDTRVVLEGVGEAKLNAAYAWGGPELAMQAVSRLLGLPVRYYVKVNLSGFRALVDLMGGVPLEVEAPMYYVDPYDNLVIDLKPGHQVLDGDRAEQYVRFRNDAMGDDLSRIRRQQRFLRAAARQALQPSNLPRLPALLATAARHVETNLPLSEQVRLTAAAIQASHRGDLITETLPGRAEYVNGISYFLHDPAGVQRLLAVWQ